MSSFSSLSPFEQFTLRMKAAATQLGLDDAMCAAVMEPNAIHEYQVPIELSTGATTIPMYRVQFSDARGPYKGGIRFHPDADLDEVKALAGMMAIKTAVVGVPMGGGKGGAQVDVKKFAGDDYQKVSRAWMRAMAAHVGPQRDVPAPDMYTNPQVMAWMLDEYEKTTETKSPAVITGKPIELGGSLGRTSATGQGGLFCLQKYLDHVGESVQGKKVIIQGFGNVGRYMASLSSAAGAIIVGVSDSSAAIYNPDGLEVEQLIAFKSTRGRFADGASFGEVIENTQLLEQPADILVLAALEDQVHQDNTQHIKAHLVLELANGPVTPAADAILAERGIVVIPDVVANAGGVTVSYFEWVQNKSGWYWDEAEVQAKLQAIMDKAMCDVIKYAEQHGLGLRDAAFAVGLGKITRAMELRGV